MWRGGLCICHFSPKRILPGQSIWKYQNFVQGFQTLALRTDAPWSRTVHLGPFSPPSPGLSSARRSLHSRTASSESSVRETTSVWGGGGSSHLAQNEWKPLRRRAGLNLGVLDARVRVRCPRLPGHPPASVPPTHTSRPESPGFCLLPKQLASPKGRGLGGAGSQEGAGSCPAHVSGRGQTGKGCVSRDFPPGGRRRAGNAESSVTFPTPVYPHSHPH